MRTPLFFSPPPFLAAAYSAPANFAELVEELLKIINLLVPFLFGLALVVFLWGIIEAWILGGGDETSVEKGKKLALGGIIGLVVMAGVWGIVAIIKESIF